ncbi:MAG: HAMP domain-containing protein [Chloroflexia bacterium]|nr:HAMP domain-containing protein [Chloroflexia bacterium]
MTRRLPFRIRLTIWYGVLFGVMFVVLGVLLYLGLRWRLYSAFDDQLQGQANIVLATSRPAASDAGFGQAAVQLQEEEYVIRLLDNRGAVVNEQGSVPNELIDAQDGIAQALEGGSSFRTVPDQDGDSLRILTLPVRAEPDGSIVGVLQVGLDRGDLDETLGQLGLGLILLIPVATLITLAGGYLLSGPALRPVAAMTTLARNINERDLHERLVDQGPRDELGRLASTFNAMLDRIERAFERQRRFTADAAHELRTPLSLMRSQVDVALSQPRTADAYRQALEGLDADLERITSLTGALLAIARLDSPGVVPDWSDVNMADTIAAVLLHFRDGAARAGIGLIPDTQPSPLVADEDMMIQVLVNLLDNALTHTGPDGTITVGCAPGAETVQVWVRDTGAGIPAGDVPRIFDRFYRPDTGRARHRGGAGLGLAIARAIVEAHHGTIALTSTVGVGTTVDIHLPGGRDGFGDGNPPPTSG